MYWERGYERDENRMEIFFFDKNEPLAGFAGYATTRLTALGFYKYKCIVPNESDLPPDTLPIYEDIVLVEEETEDDLITDGGEEEVTPADEVEKVDKEGEIVTLLIVLIILIALLIPICLLVLLHMKKNRIMDQELAIKQAHEKQNALDHLN